MLYLCGWESPQGVFVAYREDGSWVTSLFVRPRDEKAEIWEGRRVGIEGAASYWPIDRAFPLDEITSTLNMLIEGKSSIYSIQGNNDIVDEMASSSGISILDPSPILDKMRVVKSAAEIQIMQKAVEIASSAHIEAMRQAAPGMGEWHLQSILEACFTQNNSQYAYQSIVGGGENATIPVSYTHLRAHET